MAARKSAPSSVAVLEDVDTDGDGGTEATESTVNPNAARKPWPIRLYLGEIGYEFIAKRKIWYTVSAVVLLICIASMIFRQFNLGVEFAGGERFRVPGTEQQLTAVSEAVEDQGAQVTSAQAVGEDQLVIITADLSEETGAEVSQAIADAVGVDVSDVTNSTTSASWGRDVTSKALQGLLVFIVLVLIFLAIRFQWKMAVGAMVALVHDLVITAGVYSLVGFEVTPASVIGLLTILGFSLYDTVVVFDKVDENARGLVASQRRTYSESANLAINQVLMRSINTSIFALLPVLGLLYAGIFLIGEGTLQDLALVLFVGMLVGVYSSIFLAAPVLCDLKEREPEYQKLAKRLNAKRTGTAAEKPTTSKAQSRAAAATPAAAARADRQEPDEPYEPDDLNDGDQRSDEEEHPTPSGSGAGVVASARRSRPRSTRPTAGPAEAEPGSTGTAEPEPAKAAVPAAAAKSAGARLAPRPGVKPVRGARNRGGSGKQKR